VTRVPLHPPHRPGQGDPGRLDAAQRLPDRFEVAAPLPVQQHRQRGGLHPEGGRTAAALYSVVGTWKHLGIDPFAYLREALPGLFA
jgi:hypothetical protein